MSREGVVESAAPARPRGRMSANAMALSRTLLLAVLAGCALTTPGFLSAPSITSLLTTASFVGCLAAGMTFITMSGNVMSFALGASAAVSAMVFVPVLNLWGFLPALLASLSLGMVVTGSQGVLVGGIRANPIITSIAANVLIYAAAKWMTGDATLHIAPEAERSLRTGSVAGVPIEFIVFILVCVAGHVVFTWTVFGRHILLVGSGLRAAEATGLPVARTTIGAYGCAGLLAAVTGVLLASRYGQANLDLALHGDYDAIAAVLVGGNAIEGGSGSMVRTAVGVAALSVLEVVLLLYGLQEEWRYLATGTVVLVVLVLYSRRRRD